MLGINMIEIAISIAADTKTTSKNFWLPIAA